MYWLCIAQGSAAAIGVFVMTTHAPTTAAGIAMAGVVLDATKNTITTGAADGSERIYCRNKCNVKIVLISATVQQSSFRSLRNGE